MLGRDRAVSIPWNAGICVEVTQSQSVTQSALPVCYSYTAVTLTHRPHPHSRSRTKSHVSRFLCVISVDIHSSDAI